MFKVIEQDSFLPQKFDASGFNLHAHSTDPAKTLAVLVHGYGGKGYKTWGAMPEMLFSGRLGTPIDVALFDYASARRKILTRGAKVELQEKRLARYLNNLTAYESVYLIGHSLGGVIAQAATQRHLKDLNSADKQVSSVAALILFCAPRAGTGWSNGARLLGGREAQWLSRFSHRVAEIDEYFSTYVELRVTSSAGLHPRYLVPIFVGIADADVVVKPFSAGYAVPAPQRVVLVGTHSSIVKPTYDDHPQVTWLYTCLAQVEDVRAQWRREISQARLAQPTGPPPVRQHVVTELWSGTRGLEWEEAYNQVLRLLANSYYEVHDLRTMGPGTDVDLLISVHDAEDVVRSEPAAIDTVRQAHDKFLLRSQLSVGISPVGVESLKAAEQIAGWVPTAAPGGSFFIKGSNDLDQLRMLMQRWMQLVIDRDPRRARVAAALNRERASRPDPYDDPQRSGLL